MQSNQKINNNLQTKYSKYKKIPIPSLKISLLLQPNNSNSLKIMIMLQKMMKSRMILNKVTRYLNKHSLKLIRLPLKKLMQK